MVRRNEFGVELFYDYRSDRQSEFLAEAVDAFVAERGLSGVRLVKDGGRPCLTGTDFDVSFTHTRDFVLCAIGEGRIGIDAEYVREIDYQRMAKRFFPEQCLTVVDLPTFFRAWTRHEARYKLDNALTAAVEFFDIDIDDVVVALAKTANNE